MASTKRTLTETTIDSFPSTKKRKLTTDTTNTIENESKEIAPSDTTDTTTKSEPNDNETTKQSNEPETTSKWTFKESGFTFGDNSNILLNNNTLTEIKKKTSDSTDTNDTNENKTETESDKKESDTKEKEKKDPWSGIWDSSNSDGTFKLNFDWGNWENDNAKIDLNPSTSVGWESQAPKYDPNNISENKETKQLVESMGGKQDAGDALDETKYEIHCKIYNLENNKYIEKGIGMVKLNMYKINENSNELKGRILCRRDCVLNTIVNAPILKDMKFEKVGSFIRFGVVEMNENNDENDNENNSNEDDDLKAVIKTYLIKPNDKTKIDILLGKIKEIQKQVSK